MTEIKAVFWDLDDTLITTTIIRHQAQRAMISAVFAALPTKLEITKDRAFEMVERLVQHFGSSYYVQHIRLLCGELTLNPNLQQELIEIGRQAYRQTFWQISAIEGAINTLQALKGKKLQLGLASNGLYPLQMQKLTRVGLKPYFDPNLVFISSQFYRKKNHPPVGQHYSREDVDTPEGLEAAWLSSSIEKPWPLMLNHALERCQCQPNQAIFIGNRTSDIVSAKLVGVWSVHIKAHSTPEPAALLSIEEPDFFINSVADVFSVIDAVGEL